MRATKKALLLCLCLHPFSQAAADPAFELFNKSKNAVKVEIDVLDSDSDSNLTITKEVLTGEKFKVSDRVTNDTQFTMRIWEKRNMKFRDAPDFYCVFDKPSVGKTKYLTFDPSKGKGTVQIYSQTGKLKGLLGKSDSGYSLSKNIKRGDFTVLDVSEWNPLPKLEILFDKPEGANVWYRVTSNAVRYELGPNHNLSIPVLNFQTRGLYDLLFCPAHTRDPSKCQAYVVKNHDWKTMYLRWNPSDKGHALKPLIRNSKGLLGRSEDGQSLGFNVTRADIEKH